MRSSCRSSVAVLALLAVLGPVRADERRPRILGVSHVAFRTSDLAASLRFYRDFLGLAAVASDPKGGVVFRVNDRQHLALLPGLVAWEDRLDHVALQVDDEEPALAARGLACRRREGEGCFLVDTEGHSLELVRHAAATEPSVPSTEPAPVSSRLLHAGIIVGALDETRRFYESLGFREVWRGSRSGTELSWTNMRVPDGDDYLEFMLYASKPAPDDRGVQHHVCLEVPDIEAARSVLAGRTEAAGYSRPLEVRVGTNRRRQMNLFDPDGTRVELMEPHTVDGQPVPSSTAPPPRTGPSVR
jgi:lactoylglutathione lyase